MCGIVGILGRELVAASLIDALKRLEYRGYDSAPRQDDVPLYPGRVSPPLRVASPCAPYNTKTY